MQALLYGFIFGDSTAKTLGLSCSYELCIRCAQVLKALGLRGHYNYYALAMRDDLHLYYFAIKYPARNDIWTQNGGMIPSEEVMEELSRTLGLPLDWYGYEDVTDGE
ncbi:hypothetical protein BDP27DRAFT_1339511, partial [Rhodocollybia butyracea]